MVEREIVWSETARHQLRYILAFWREKNKSNAYSDKILIQVSKHITLMIKFPFLATAITDTEFRRSILGHYSMLYVVHPQQIFILYFWDNRQDPQKFQKAINYL
jgi:toxin YoeB